MNIPQSNVRRFKLKLFTSELLATLLFTYLSQSALASFELIGTNNDILARHMCACLTQGLALFIALSMRSHLVRATSAFNPALTFANAAFKLIDWSQVPLLISAQYLGAFLSAALVHLTFGDKIGARHADGLLLGMNETLRAHGNAFSTGKLFTSFPPTEVSLTQLFISYTLASGFFASIVALITNQPSRHCKRNLFLQNSKAILNERSIHEREQVSPQQLHQSNNNNYQQHHHSHQQHSAAINSPYAEIPTYVDLPSAQQQKQQQQQRVNVCHNSFHNYSNLAEPSNCRHIVGALKPLYVASGLTLIHAAFGANGGPVLNPAQDLSPRIYISLFGWSSAAFNLFHYNYWWFCCVFAPHFGACLGLALQQAYLSTY